MVIKAFKKLFIPHKHNDYKPHFFREASIVTLSIVAVFLLTISIGTRLYIKNSDMTATVLPAVLVDLTNDARLSNNQKILARNTTLDSAAQLKAVDMAENGYFAHTSPAGITPWYWFNKAGYTFIYAGENLAVDFTESIDVENAWLASPTHKANIMSDKFSEIGIATMDGIYEGRPTTYVVQMFGKPAFTEDVVKKDKEVEKKPKLEDVKKEPATVLLAPSVKGQSIDIKKDLETIADTKEFVAVKNIKVADPDPITSQIKTDINPKTEQVHYSSWTDRFIFLAPGYANKIYKALVWIVAIALLLMIGIEFKRQHPKNIIYGILILIIMISFIYINRSVFVTDLII
jgi:hypothetical protein